MLVAYNGIRSNQTALRASAVEFLDNLLQPDFKRLLLPILEAPSLAIVVGKTGGLFSFPENSNSAYLRYLIQGRDAWLKTIAIYAVGSFKLAELAPLIRDALNDVGDPFISQTAQWSWSQLNP
jgi:hypothetical protein